jgi:Zn-dependent M28 family amino/carboxypeptidase
MLIIAALDCEEIGMQGAKALIDLVTAPHIALNVNIDMISRDVEGKLYAVGTRSYPFLRPYLTRLPQRPHVNLLFGFDGSDPNQDDWTFDSDHAAFHRAGIPFIYFGEENPEHHHQHTDDPSTVLPEYYAGSVETIAEALIALDRNLATIVRASGR